MPNASGMCEWVLDPVEERKTTVKAPPMTNMESGSRGVAPPMQKLPEEAQGFYALDEKEEEVNERFDPPMEVTHFPPVAVEKRPPQAWEIKWNDNEGEDVKGEEKQEEEEKEKEVRRSEP